MGVGGNGMSALAQLRAFAGDSVTGSDRLHDAVGLGDAATRLDKAGVRLVPQDGRSVAQGLDRVVVSSAVEEGNADLARARALGLPVMHRADELAEQAAARETIAVAGTSGKSTVTAMIWHILDAEGLSPSLACGANLLSLRGKGLLGNAFLGKSRIFVMEADESDGTLTRYKPALGILLNLTKDHKGLDELRALFKTFAGRSKTLVASADAPGLAEFLPGAVTFGFTAGDLRGGDLKLLEQETRFTAGGAAFRLPLPGRHNAENALAAAAACARLGVSPQQSARALAGYGGLARRFERLGERRGVLVVDDFAHNPEKVKAAIAAARLGRRRVLAVFQLHGFAPARFMKAEFLDAFAEALCPQDRLWLPDIYYAGGTAARDVSAQDYAEALASRGLVVRHAPDKKALPALVAAEATKGDIILVMGARDPSLPELARTMLAAL